MIRDFFGSVHVIWIFIVLVHVIHVVNVVILFCYVFIMLLCTQIMQQAVKLCIYSS